jgi:peroxiredoxin
MDIFRACAAAGLLLIAAGCASGKAAVREGTPPPVLTASDGSSLTVAELVKGRDATVLVFWSSSCPCVRRYQDRVDGLLDAYPADRVRVVGISSNAGESYEKVVETARRRGVRIPIYRDESGAVASTLGARSTPTVVVLDPDGKVRFFGWFDNEYLPGDPGRKPWLDQALAGILAGRNDFSASTKTFGCIITRSLFGSPEPTQQCTHCASH